MSVQTSYRLYQNEKGVGVIAENNPYDIGAFITGDVSVNAVQWGCFVVRSSGREIVAPSSTLAKIVGATTKQEDRVEGQFGGINKDTSSNSGLSFSLSQGRPASVMRMGYLNMVCASSSWVEGNAIFVKVANAVKDKYPLGAVAATAISADYEALTAAVFGDSSANTGVQQVAKVFFDTRLPVATTKPSK